MGQDNHPFFFSRNHRAESLRVQKQGWWRPARSRTRGAQEEQDVRLTGQTLHVWPLTSPHLGAQRAVPNEDICKQFQKGEPVKQHLRPQVHSKAANLWVAGYCQQKSKSSSMDPGAFWETSKVPSKKEKAEIDYFQLSCKKPICELWYYHSSVIGVIWAEYL